MANLREDRNAGTGETEFVHVRGISDRSGIDEAAFQGVRADTAKYGFVGHDGLDDAISLSRAQLVASEVVGVQDVDLPILARRDSNLRDTGAFESSRIQQRNTARAEVLVTTVHALVVIWLEIVRQ